jgi:hypothetical protein
LPKRKGFAARAQGFGTVCDCKIDCIQHFIEQEKFFILNFRIINGGWLHMMMERMSHAITSWLPVSIVAAGIAMMAGSLLNLPVAKIITAAVTSGAVISAFIMGSYGKEKERMEYAGIQVSQYK